MARPSCDAQISMADPRTTSMTPYYQSSYARPNLGDPNTFLLLLAATSMNSMGMMRNDRTPELEAVMRHQIMTKNMLEYL